MYYFDNTSGIIAVPVYGSFRHHSHSYEQSKPESADSTRFRFLEYAVLTLRS
jgi:hypothetical protein